MATDKKITYDMQGGVRNYLGKQKQVKAPLKWQSSPDHPTTELAYITQAEKDLLVKQDLHGSLNGGVNRGPSGIMSLNGFGSADSNQNVSGSQVSAAETGGGGGSNSGSGMSQSDANDFRSAAINAGAGQRVNPGFFDSVNVISPEEVAMAKDYRNQNNIQGTIAQNAYNKTRGGAFGNFISGGGITGGIIKGLGQMFGLGKKYNEPTYDIDNRFNSLGVYNDTFEGVPFKSKGQLGRSRTLTDAGILTQQGDYDIYGNKINELTGEILDPVTGEVIDIIPGYPGGSGDGGGITTIPQGGSDEYVNLINQYVPDEPAIPNNAFKARFLPDSTPEEKARKKEIEKMINEKFKYDYNSFGLGDMDGS